MSSVKTIKKPIIKIVSKPSEKVLVPTKSTIIKKPITGNTLTGNTLTDNTLCVTDTESGVKITKPTKPKTTLTTTIPQASNITPINKVGKIIKKINSKVDAVDKISNIPVNEGKEKDAKIEIETETETEIETEIETESEMNIKTEQIPQTTIIKKRGAVNAILTNYKEYSTLEKFKNFTSQLNYAPLDQVSPNYKNLYISNGNIKHDIVPIILKLHNMRIRSIYNVNSKIKQSVPIWLSIYTELIENARLLTFLTRLENEITRKIKEITGKVLQKTSCITKHPNYYPDIKINAPFTRIGNCVEFPFTILDKKNRAINFASIVRGAKMNCCYIELDYVWISDTAFGINWTLKRAIVEPESIWKKKGNVFDDEEEDVVNDDEEEIIPKECFHCMYCPNNHVRTHCCLGGLGENKSNGITNVLSRPNSSIPLPPPPPLPSVLKNLSTIVEDKPAFIPSLSDLLAGKSRLKAVAQKTDNSIIKKNNEENNITIMMDDIKKTLKSFE